MGSESVKVVVRCRPLNDREKALGSKMVLSMDLHRCQCFLVKTGVVDEPPKQFTFDGTYFIDQTTEQMYNEIAYPLVEVSCLFCLQWQCTTTVLRSRHYKSSTLVSGHNQSNNSSLYLIANDCRPHYLFNSLLSVTYKGQQSVDPFKKPHAKGNLCAIYLFFYRVSLRDTMAQSLPMDKLEVESLSPCREYTILQPRGGSFHEHLSTYLRVFR